MPQSTTADGVNVAIQASLDKRAACPFHSYETPLAGALPEGLNFILPPGLGGAAAPLTIENVVVNDGSPQLSVVNDPTITFERVVTFYAGVFGLERHDGSEDRRTDAFFGSFGDGDVDGLDRDLFRSAFAKSIGETGYLPFLDYDGDGDARMDLCLLIGNLHKGRAPDLPKTEAEVSLPPCQ